MRENILSGMNQLLSYTWLFVIVGTLIAAWTERKLIQSLFQNNGEKKEWYKALIPLWKRLSYVALGFLLVLTSFAISNTLLEVFHTVLTGNRLENTNTQNTSVFFRWLMQDQTYIGLYSTILFTVSGYLLILSAGRKWLKTNASILFTFSIILLFVASLGDKALNG